MTAEAARAKLADLMARDFVSPADYARIGRLAKIVARATGTTSAAVLASF